MRVVSCSAKKIITKESLHRQWKWQLLPKNILKEKMQFVLFIYCFTMAQACTTIIIVKTELPTIVTTAKAVNTYTQR